MIHRPLLAQPGFILIKHKQWQHHISVAISIIYYHRVSTAYVTYTPKLKIRMRALEISRALSE